MIRVNDKGTNVINGSELTKEIHVNISFKHRCSCYHINLMHIRILNMVILSKDVIENTPEADDNITYREAEELTEKSTSSGTYPTLCRHE